MNYDNFSAGAPAAWNDFNDADAQQGEYNLIPKGTQAKVRMAIKPGGHDDLSRGWSGGYATASDETGAVFLACEFVVLGGPFARRKVWSNVGLHSNKGPTWGQMGRSFIRAVLNSARNIHPEDNSPEAQRARQIRGFGDLDGIEFAARIGVEKDGKGELRNVIRMVIEPDHRDYADLAQNHHADDSAGGDDHDYGHAYGNASGRGGQGGHGGQGGAAPVAASAPYTPRPASAGIPPAWAQ